MPSELTLAQNDFSSAELQIIHRTVAKDATRDEFDFFLQSARLYGLNPLKKQIRLNIYNKDKPSRRSTALIVEIGGLRAIAKRSGHYRPAEKPPTYIVDEERKSDLNPLGIVEAQVTLFTRDDSGQWFPVCGTADWDEFAKVKDQWVDGKRTGQKELDGNWKTMPKRMIAKCAEAQALRQGWPEEVGGLYEEAETGDVIDVDGDLTPTERLEAANAKDRRAMIGAKADEYTLQFAMGGALEPVPAGQVYDRVAAYCRDLETSMEVADFKDRNKLSLQRFWADHKSDALEVNALLEDRMRALSAEHEAA